MKSIIVILLLNVFMVLISGELEIRVDDNSTGCTDGENPMIAFAYFSEHGHRYISFLYKDANEVDLLNENEERFLSLCLCRSNHNAQHFFISPYSLPKNDTEAVEYHDAIILCLIGHENFESIGIYDDEELFDILLMKKNEAVPNSVINPFGVEEYKDNDEPACYDFNGFPTKNILGQRTCLLAAEFSHEKIYIYSGPLMGKAMIMDSMEYCYTFVNDSMRSNNFEDFCSTSISSESVKVQCCCTHSSHLCSPKGLSSINKREQLYCLTGHMGNTVDIIQEPLKNYIENAVNSYCATTISITTEGNVGEETNNYKLIVFYVSVSKCANKTRYEMNDKKFCSFDPKFPDKVSILKCCKDEHFCNRRFIPKNIQPLNCHYKPDYAAYMTDEIRCETFYDIWLKAHLKVIFDYNAKISENQRRHDDTSLFGFEYRYIYYQIIKEDSEDCTLHTKYTLTNVKEYRPFIHMLCTTLPLSTEPCDFHNPKPDSKIFKCEILESTEFDKVESNHVTIMEPTAGGWICFVEIYYDDNLHKNYIRAGELKDFSNHVECLEKDMMNEMYCCSDIFSTKQNDTLCTVEKLIKYNKKLRQSDPTKSGSEKEFFSNCIIRELPLDSCSSESGCFETRMLEFSKNSDSLEPAGCIDNTEKYISQDKSSASVSLGCRVPENSNKCSVISSVDGNQRILCCCNGEECKNDATNLPKEIGKKISSFKDPK